MFNFLNTFIKTAKKKFKLNIRENSLGNVFCFEYILLNYSKGSETSSGNLLVPLLIYNNMSCKL